MKSEILNEKNQWLSKAPGYSGISALQVVLGSIFLALMAQVAIPLPYTPVPMSMQPLAVALLAMTLGSRKAALAVVTYLLQASVGLPVLIGGTVNPLWMIAPRAGYLIGFVVSAFVVGKLLERLQQSSFIKSWFILSLNEVIILSLGSLWLGIFVGWENALVMGALPFIPAALLKTTIAASSYKIVK